MNWKGKTTMAMTFLLMVTPKIIDDVEDFFDEDPATVFSWRFMLALLAAPTLVLIASLISKDQ